MAQQLDDDTQGNILGERATFIYTDNLGVQRNMTQDSSVAVAVGNVLSTNAGLPDAFTSSRRGLKLRYVNLEGQTEPEKKKRVVIGDPANALASGASTSVTINGVLYRVVTVVGERRSRKRVQPAA